MSGSYDVMGKAETELTRQDIIVETVQRALREQSQLIPTVRDVSDKAVLGADSIDFNRRVGAFEVQNLEEESEADIQTYKYTPDKLLLDKHMVIAWFLKKRANAQSALNLEMDTVEEAAAEHAIDIDRKLITAMLANASAANNVSVTGAITRAKILEAKAKLQAAVRLNTKNANFFLLINSKHEAEMLDIAGFVDADKYGSNQTIVTGELGRIFGIRTLITDESVLGDSNGLMYIDQGIVYGNQLAPELNSLYIPKKVGTEYALDQLYGTKVLNEGKYISHITFS